MNMDNNLIAVIIGIVEGVTEFFAGIVNRTYDNSWQYAWL